MISPTETFIFPCLRKMEKHCEQKIKQFCQMKWNNIKIEEVKMEIFWVKMFHKREKKLKLFRGDLSLSSARSLGKKIPPKIGITWKLL